MWRAPATELERRTEPEPELKTPETTDTQDSYQTVPELSEPAKQLFETFLEQKTPIKTKINTMVLGADEKKLDVEMKDETYTMHIIWHSQGFFYI